MAKSTQQQALLTEQRIHKAIIDIFMEKGWQAISYGSIAKHTGLSRGGVQRIVPTKDAMMLALQEQVSDVVYGQLNFSDEATLSKSWLAALENTQFRHCLKFCICSISTDSSAKEFAKGVFEKLSETVGEEKMHSLIGLSVYYLI